MQATSGCDSRPKIVIHVPKNKSPMEVFEKLFGDKIYDHLVKRTNFNSTQKKT